MGRHAYLILAHKNPRQLCKLLGLLDDGRNDIFVHLDKKAGFGTGVLEHCCSKSKLHFIRPSIAVHWGGVSIMKAELALLKAAVPGDYDYYHLLSGMDLPIKTQDEIHDFFDARPNREFLMLWKPYKDAMDRVELYRLFPDGNRFLPTRLINDLFQFIQKKLNLRISGMPAIHFASQWFSIDGDFARYLTGREKFLTDTFGHTNICDEIFVATALMSSEFADRIYDSTLYDEHLDIHNTANMRYVDWSRSANGRHPWTFTSEDLSVLQTIPHFWARKFDETIDGKIIDSICGILEK